MNSSLSVRSPALYRFENAHLFPVERRLLVDGRVASLGARAFDVLLALIERRERLVTRDELLDLCWPESAVEPNNVDVQIVALRRVVGRHVIVSVPGRGFRFGAIVEAKPADETMSLTRLTHRTNLPELRPLIGRGDEVCNILKLVGGHRLVTVIGAGGIGKSLLAQHVLDGQRNAFRHGVCWVELDSVSDPAVLPVIVAAALGIGLPTGNPTAGLEAAIAPLDILIALDNAEHLLEEVGALVEAIGRTAPQIRILVTSQSPLRLPQEQVFRLGPLATPTRRVGALEAMRFGAVALFVRRAKGADLGFELTDDNSPVVIGLCEQLDGLPLAMELAAARLRMLDVGQIAAAMHQRLHVLSGGFRNAPARQQTMTAALEWSWQLLGANERIVFRRMAVAAGSASFDLVQAIAVDVDHTTPDADGLLDSRAVVEALGGLVDRSLVATVVSPVESSNRRYRLLEMPRAFAVKLLAEAGEVGLIEERHARAVAALLREAWRDRWGGAVGYRAWIDRVEADSQNARAADRWARQRSAVDLVLAIAPVLLNRVLPSSAYEDRVNLAQWLDLALSTRPTEADQLPARMALMRFWNEQDARRSLAEAVRTLTLADSCGDRFAAYFVCAWQVRLLVQARDLEAATAALARVDVLEDPSWPAIRLWMGAEARCIYRLVVGPPQRNVELCRRELEIVRLAGDAGHLTTGNLVDALVVAGQPSEAAKLGSQLVSDLSASRNEFGLLVARINLAAAFLTLSDVTQAGPVLRAAWPAARQFGLQGDCADYLALLAALQQRWHASAAIAGYADAVYARRGAQRWPNEMLAHEQATDLCRAAMDAAAFGRATSDGLQLADVEVPALAFEGLSAG